MLTVSERAFVVRAADRAPSLHGSRPWRVVAHSDAIDVLIYPRPSDGPARGTEALIACGAASLHAQLAVAELGRRCRVQLLPDPGRPDLAARLLPLAPGWGTPDDVVLLPAARGRRGHCAGSASAPVAGSALARLGAAAAREHVWAQALSGGDVLELACLQAMAQDGGPHSLAEALSCASWRGGQAHDDCVPGWPAEATPHGRTAPGEVLLVLGTVSTSPQARVAAGRALARVLLTAATLGLATAPGTLSLALPTVRDALVAAMSPLGAPLLTVRASRADAGRADEDRFASVAARIASRAG